MRALRDFNTPKIVQQDEVGIAHARIVIGVLRNVCPKVVFFGLLRDLFPGINPPRKVRRSIFCSEFALGKHAPGSLFTG
jgi:hypothetical protein